MYVQNTEPPPQEDSSILPSDPASGCAANVSRKPADGEEVQSPPSTGNDPQEDFPIKSLNSLDEQLNRPKWVVPVRPDDELEKLLKASIKLCREGVLSCL